jgi:potassium efflux system protein
MASRSRGLLDRHLGCHARVREVLLQSLHWLLPVLAVCALLVGATNLSGHHVDTLGRAAFAIGAGSLSLFVWRALNPEAGLLSEHFVPARRHGWQWNLRRLWFGGLALLPVAFGVLALSGYYYTAQQLLSRYCATGLLVAAVILGRQIALRGLALFEQRLARQQALARRDAARRREEEKEIEARGEATVEVVEAHEVDVGTVNVQVRAFLRVAVVLVLGCGFWWIWADLLPALAALREIVLWEYTSGSGEHQRPIAVTAAGLGLALLVAVITYLAARNLPGLLEVVVLQRLEVDAGARYAANAVSRYLIIVVGVLVVVSMLGLEWSKLQWLVAALGVGLGFGLQEVVGNFVSGLIILFERPFRVGDTVTIGSVSGTVTRIQIRATTITDWDRKELIVPNKLFITDQLVNWTLNDPVLRVIVPVGIAYGSDTALARRLLMEIAEANPRALPDPAPQVWFMGFGESSLSFEVRVFVMGLPEMLPVTHELHEAIDAAFRRNGIEIAFPQRDLHLRSLDPRVAELLRGQSLPAPSPQAPV